MKPPQAVLLAAVLLVAARVVSAAELPGARLLSPAELAAMDRENEMWREIRPDQNVAANLARLRQKGFTEKEAASIHSRLEALWDVPYERNFGWLHEDTVRQIEAIDRGFIIRMRALRVYKSVGIRLPSFAQVSEDTLNRLWHRAILRALDYDEIAEFRLMNSASAREVSRRVDGLKLSADELRTLFEWERIASGRQPGVTMSSQTPAWLREEQLDDWRRTRDLLGDERFAIYLSRANPSFARMLEVLAQGGPISPTVALDLWWLRRKDGAERDEVPQTVQRDQLTVRMRERAVALMGEARFATYERDPDARWVVIPVRPNQRPTDTIPRRAGITAGRKVDPP